MKPSFLRLHAVALAIFTFVFLVRLVALGRLSDSPYGLPATGDMKFYADWALRIAGGEWTDLQAFYGQPLYAYLLAIVFAIAGFQPFWIGLFQGMLDAATAVILYKLGVHVFGRGRNGDTPVARNDRATATGVSPLPVDPGAAIGLLAAAGWAFYVPAAAYSGLLIPTSYVVALWWLVVWWILHRRPTARWGEWLSVSLLIGLTSLFAATVLFSLPLLLAGLPWRRAGRALIPLVAGVVVGAAPAWSHNVFLARDPVFISAHGGLNFWIGNNPDANGYPKIPPGLPSEQAPLLEASIRSAEGAAGHRLPRSEVSAHWSRKAVAYIRENPIDWMTLLARKLRNFWSAFRYDDLSAITPLRDAGVIPPGLHFGLLAALGLPGACLAFRNRRALWIIAAIALQLIALLPVFVNERYRLPASPGLLLLSAFFLVEVGARIFAREGRRLIAPSAALAISALFVYLPPADPALRSVDDFKAGRRQLVANDFARAEKRLRLAAAAVVPPTEIDPAVAKMFAEAAGKKWAAGEHAAARRTVAAAVQLDPANEELQRLLAADEPLPPAEMR